MIVVIIMTTVFPNFASAVLIQRLLPIRFFNADDFDANFGLTEDKMVNDDKFEGEIVGEGGTKDQDEKKAFETVLEGEFHDQDQSENGKLDSLGMETYDNAAEGKNVGRGGRTGVDIGYQGKGKHLSLNEKINIQIPKGNALQSFVLGGRGANFKPLGGRLRHYGNQGLKSLANIVPKRGTARNVVTADLFGKTETKGTRGKENKKGMTSEGESGFVDGQTSFTKTTETSKGTARSRNEISFSSTGLPLAAEVKGQAESRYLQSYGKSALSVLAKTIHCNCFSHYPLVRLNCPSRDLDT